MISAFQRTEDPILIGAGSFPESANRQTVRTLRLTLFERALTSMSKGDGKADTDTFINACPHVDGVRRAPMLADSPRLHASNSVNQ
jgi:hypothetical protein